MQRSLEALSTDTQSRARKFINESSRIWSIVYDNINFTLRHASQRIDAGTQQLNATTSALIAFPAAFTREAYSAALSLLGRRQPSDKRSKMTAASLMPTKEANTHLRGVFKFAVASILFNSAPGRNKRRKHLRKVVKKMRPKVRTMGHEKTQFFPLPALDQEEASVAGTIRVVEKIFTKLLGLAADMVPKELRLMVGDWLTIRNLRLMRGERQDEFTDYAKMDWVQEASMPFHFMLNAMYMLMRTHVGNSKDGDPGSLEKHRQLLRRSKLDPKHPEYNKAKELVFHSLTARILDCTR